MDCIGRLANVPDARVSFEPAGGAAVAEIDTRFRQAHALAVDAQFETVRARLAIQTRLQGDTAFVDFGGDLWLRVHNIYQDRSKDGIE